MTEITIYHGEQQVDLAHEYPANPVLQLAAMCCSLPKWSRKDSYSGCGLETMQSTHRDGIERPQAYR